MIHLSSCLYSFSEITGLLSFVSPFFYISYTSISLYHNQVLHYDAGEQNLSLETALDLSESSLIW